MNKIVFKIQSLQEEEFLVNKLVLPRLAFLKKKSIIFTLPKTSIEEEYNPTQLEAFKQKLEKDWDALNNNFFEKLESFFGTTITDPFLVHVSNYGPLGRYLYKTHHVFINIHIEEKSFKATRTVEHEIIHLIIEPFVQKYNINQEKKEKIVNAIVDLFE